MKMSFDNPLSVSNGKNSDRMQINIKEPSYFVSAESGEMLQA
jgi:hypothetical protein